MGPDRSGAKVAIVGAGAVGATIAYACLLRGVAPNVVLYDLDRRKAEAQALDLEHGMPFMPPATVRGSDDIGVCAGADVVVVTAGARQHPGQSRRELATSNVAMVRGLVPELLGVAPDAVVVMVSNPVDVLTQVALEVSGVGPARVVGSGTVLDSARLRTLLAARCGVAASSVHAYMAGEHGDSSVALWSAATIGGVPARLRLQRGAAGADVDGVLAAMADQVRQAAYRIIEGKGATSYAIGLAVAEIARAVLFEEHRILPVSTLQSGWGPTPVCFSMPSVLGRAGVREVLEMPLSDDERRALAASADVIRANLADAGG